MKTILLALILFLIPVTCYATYNPIDHASETIRRDTNNAMDDAINKVRVEAQDAQKEMVSRFKNFMRGLIGNFLSVFTILAIGYIFSYLVPKTTGKMILVVTILCGLNELIKLFV